MTLEEREDDQVEAAPMPTTNELFIRVQRIEAMTTKWKIATAVSTTIAVVAIIVILFLANALSGFQGGRDARNCRDEEIAKSIDPISGVIVGTVNDDDELRNESNGKLADIGSLEERFRACNEAHQ